MSRLTIVAILSVLFLSLSYPVVCEAQDTIPDVGFRNLTVEETRLIAEGQTVFRQPSSWRDLSMPEAASYHKELTDSVRKGGYNYLGEVILAMPAATAREAIPAITKRLRDVEKYAGIPYWSSRQETFYDLFDWVKVTGGIRSPELAYIETLQYMEPFGEYQAVYEWKFGDTELSFSGVNTSTLSYLYNGIKADRKSVV